MIRSVAKRPGTSVFSVTPSPATWRASVLNAPSIPARATVESMRLGIGSRIVVDETDRTDVLSRRGDALRRTRRDGDRGALPRQLGGDAERQPSGGARHEGAPALDPEVHDGPP